MNQVGVKHVNKRGKNCVQRRRGRICVQKEEICVPKEFEFMCKTGWNMCTKGGLDLCQNGVECVSKEDGVVLECKKCGRTCVSNAVENVYTRGLELCATKCGRCTAASYLQMEKIRNLKMWPFHSGLRALICSATLCLILSIWSV